MSALAARWNRFWFAPTPTSTLAVVRIAYGLVVLAWSLSLAADLSPFFSASGLVPDSPAGGWTWSLLAVLPSDGAVTVLYAVLVASAVCVAVGFRTRLAAVVVLVAMLSFQRRTPFLFNGGDMLLRILGLYLAAAPAGAALSVDRWRRHRDRFWEFPDRAPWALRLIQVQLSIVYLFTVWEKVRGTTWNGGTAVSYAMRVDELGRFAPPSWLTDSLLVSNVLTFGTLAVELALAVLVWNGKARPWVLAAGVLLHASIELTMGLGFFSATMLVGYVAFVPAPTIARGVLALRQRCATREFPRRTCKGSTRGGLPPVSQPLYLRGGTAMTTTPTNPTTLTASTTLTSTFRRLVAPLAVGAALYAGAALLVPAVATAQPGGPPDAPCTLTPFCQDGPGYTNGQSHPDDGVIDLQDGGTLDLTLDDGTVDDGRVDLMDGPVDLMDGPVDLMDGPVVDDGRVDLQDGPVADDGGILDDGGTRDDSGDRYDDGSPSDDGGDGGHKVPRPRRIDTGAGGSAAGSGGSASAVPALAMLGGGVVALVAVGARRRIATRFATGTVTGEIR